MYSNDEKIENITKNYRSIKPIKHPFMLCSVILTICVILSIFILVIFLYK